MEAVQKREIRQGRVSTPVASMSMWLAAGELGVNSGPDNVKERHLKVQGVLDMIVLRALDDAGCIHDQK